MAVMLFTWLGGENRGAVFGRDTAVAYPVEAGRPAVAPERTAPET